MLQKPTGEQLHLIAGNYYQLGDKTNEINYTILAGEKGYLVARYNLGCEYSEQKNMYELSRFLIAS